MAFFHLLLALLEGEPPTLGTISITCHSSPAIQLMMKVGKDYLLTDVTISPVLQLARCADTIIDLLSPRSGNNVGGAASMSFS